MVFVHGYLHLVEINFNCHLFSVTSQKWLVMLQFVYSSLS